MTTLDTTIHEPSMTAGEVEMQLFALERSRAQFAWKCGGLDAASLNKPFPPSTMTMGGLLKHLALVEDRRTSLWVTGEPLQPPWGVVDHDADPDWEWRTAAEPVPAVRATLGLHGHAGLAQHRDVAPGGPLGHAEGVRQPGRGDAGVVLEHLEAAQRPRGGVGVVHGLRMARSTDAIRPDAVVAWSA